MTEPNISIENKELLLQIIEYQKEFITSLEALRVHFDKINRIEEIVTNGIVTKKYYDEKQEEFAKVTKKNIDEVRLQHVKDIKNNRIFVAAIVIIGNILLGSLLCLLHGGF